MVLLGCYYHSSNLDLGFEVMASYNGMTSYAATWLSFIFPAYVLLIVAAMALLVGIIK